MRCLWKLTMLYLLCLSSFLEFFGSQSRLFPGGFDFAYLRLAHLMVVSLRARREKVRYGRGCRL